MNSEMNTLELAKLYESQGYDDKAHEIYSALQKIEPSKEAAEGLERTRNGLSPKQINGSVQGSTQDLTQDSIGEKADSKPVSTDSASGRERIASLFEKWIKLLVVKQRLDKFKRIKARLS